MTEDIQETAPEPTTPDADPLRRSRTSSVWFAVVGLVLVLLLLIIFIAQNTQQTAITFVWWEGSAPLSVTVLGAALAGMTLVVVAGSLRILQLRRRVRRDRRAASAG